jgi:hypothetical protein
MGSSKLLTFGADCQPPPRTPIRIVNYLDVASK